MICEGIIYGQTLLPHPDGSVLLARTVQKLLAAIPEDPNPEILWTLSYTKHVPRSQTLKEESYSTSALDPTAEHPLDNPVMVQSRVITLSELSPDLALEDSVLQEVKSAWEKIVGEEGGEGFMLFEERDGGGAGGDDDEVAENEF